jgi:DNA polymerase I-like protein with 3'-5' exonuclease and polymerase domains
VNTPIQGSGADLVIWAVNRFMHELPEGVEIINLVHDEVDAIVTSETLKATVDVITRAFQETFAGFSPSSELVPKIKFCCGPSWGENYFDRWNRLSRPLVTTDSSNLKSNLPNS